MRNRIFSVTVFERILSNIFFHLIVLSTLVMLYGHLNENYGIIYHGMCFVFLE